MLPQQPPPSNPQSQPQPPAQTPRAPALTVTPNLALQTGAGVITARAPIQLPEGTRVELEVVRTANNQVSTRLIAVNGLQVQGARPLPVQNPAPTVQNPAPTGQPPAQNPPLTAQTLPPGHAWTPAGPVQLATLGPISAFVILGSPAPSGAENPLQPGAQPGQTGQQAGVKAPQTGPQTPALAPGPLGQPATQPTLTAPTFQLFTGGDLAVRLTTVQMPGGVTPQTAPPIAPPAPGPLGQPVAQPSLAVPTPAQGAAPTAPSLAQPQPGLILPGPQGLLPAAPVPPQTVPPVPVLTTLTGKVTALSPTGAPLVQIDTPQVQGQIQLNARANVPVGTVVTFEVTAQNPPQTGAAAAPPNPISAMPLSGPAGANASWPTLSESLAILQRTDPQAASQLAQSIPDGGPRTAVALIAFVQALRTGDPRQWPGDANLRAVERTGPRGMHLATQLSGEVSEMAARARDVGGEWRSVPIPWNADGCVERITLVTRREEPQDEESKKQSGGKDTRFLINSDLSKLGSMQLDGIFRKETRGSDLMIRTKETLPDHMRRDLTGMFASSNAAMGLKGGLTFQVVKKFPDPVASSESSALDKPGLWA